MSHEYGKLPQPRRTKRRMTAAVRELMESRVSQKIAPDALAQDAIALYHTEKAKAEERRIRKGGKSIQQIIQEVDARMTDEMLERRARVKGHIDVSAINVPHRRYHRGGEMQHWYGRSDD